MRSKFISFRSNKIRIDLICSIFSELQEIFSTNHAFHWIKLNRKSWIARHNHAGSRRSWEQVPVTQIGWGGQVLFTWRGWGGFSGGVHTCSLTQHTFHGGTGVISSETLKKSKINQLYYTSRQPTVFMLMKHKLKITHAWKNPQKILLRYMCF